MKWLEIIELRSVGKNRKFLEQDLKSLIEELNKDVIDLVWTLKESVSTGFDVKTQIEAENNLQKALNHARRSSAISIIIDSFAHNIAGHSLSSIRKI